MKFSWVTLPDGVPRPIIRCSLRNGTTPIPTDLLFLLDTGADTTTIPVKLAAMLGYAPADLESKATNAVGGKTTVLRPKAAVKVEVEIGGSWYPLPGLAFAENTPPLLGRDLLFRFFKLRMEQGETELRPK